MSARARSRSPRGQLSFREISELVFDREKARLAKDWSLADQLRSQLQDVGVQLFDKARQWKSSDGRGGRIPSFDELEAKLEAGGDLEANADALAIEALADPKKEQIQSLVLQREQARGSKDFAEADHIRSKLQDMGVELMDKEKLWKCESKGLFGIITGFRNNELSDVEVHTLVAQRERARMNNDYELSDMIRNELKSRGVTIEDKQKLWSCSDGRRGAVPSWAQISGEAPMTFAPQRVAGPPFAVPIQVLRPPQGIEDELVSLAVAAARHPDTASRALAALRQVLAAPPALAAPRVMKPMPTARPRELPEMTRAKQLIRDIKDMKKVSDREIEWLVATRERFRMTKNYDDSDELRAELQSVGIELLEKEKRWTFEGRTGDIPLWSNMR